MELEIWSNVKNRNCFQLQYIQHPVLVLLFHSMRTRERPWNSVGGLWLAQNFLWKVTSTTGWHVHLIVSSLENYSISLNLFCTCQTFTQTRMHSSRIRTARSSSHLGGSPPPGTRHPPRSRHPPPGPGPPGQEPLGTRHPPRDQAPRLWTETLTTHATENIKLPQTSFAGGN